MFKRILVAIDGSEVSTNALQHAINLAQEQHATLCILNVIDEYMPSTGDTIIDIDKFAQALNELSQQILDNATKMARQASIEFEVKSSLLEPLQGRIADRIVEIATEWKTDLIVIGSHGRHGFQRLLLGSVADTVIRITTIPVLLIHGQ
ncbi:MAG: universal stress protein [Gammaproteobacteria bacterium]